MAKRQPGSRAKTAKSADKRPARARYWSENHLRKSKVRNLVRCNGMTELEASVFWRRIRTKRIKK